MIRHVTGKLVEAQPTCVVVEVNGIGHEVIIPLSSFDRLPRRGETVTILTVLQIKDERVLLYGFMTEEERALFKLLISVSGVGPKVAIGILSGISPGNFRTAVHEGNTRMLSMVPGIGKKTAERLIVELRDKIEGLSSMGKDGAGKGASTENRIVTDAALALISLGFTQSGAQKAIRTAVERSGTPDNVETLVREALKSA